MNTTNKEIEKLLISLNKTKFRGSFHYATGTCCRDCLERIHHVEKNRELTTEEINYIVKIIMMWIKNETESKV